MRTTRPAPSVQDINVALVATQKRKDGEKLSRSERRSVDAFRDLYRDANEVKSHPGLCHALEGVLANLPSNATDVADNPLLSQHLKALRAAGTATDAQIAQIKTLARKLSDGEDDGISTTLAQLTLNDGISKSALDDISQYLDAERSARSSAVTAGRVKRGFAVAGTAVAGALLLPLLSWIPPIGAALTGLAGGAIQAVQIGTLAGGSIGGGTLGSLLGRSFTNSGANYGVKD